ncbi:MAG: hypothetical protein JXA71_01190 [Chitinispirillaceae bacterium]|nr:hypothetical protein [Chitinispirillaceae bacterium]
MRPDDEAVFEVQARAPAGEKGEESAARYDDAADMDFSGARDLQEDFDDVTPKRSIIGTLAGIFKKPAPHGQDDDDLTAPGKSLPENDDFPDDEFPKPSFLQNLFSGFGKKSIDEDDDLTNLRIPRQ